MKFFIDGKSICDQNGERGAGIEHYSWSIVSAITKIQSPNQFVLSTPSCLTEQRIKAITEGSHNLSIQKSLNINISFLSRHIISPLMMYMKRPDVLFAPSGQIPLGWRGKSVITIHDLAVYEHPEWFEQLGDQDFSKKIAVPNSIKKASHIIAVSKATEDSLIRLFPEAEGKTTVIYEGVEETFEPEFLSESTRFPFDRDYVLFLGTMEPRKNLENAFRAFHTFLESRPDQATQVRFIVAGKRGWGAEPAIILAEQINQAWSSVEPDGVIQFLGAVTEEEKWILLRGASVMLFPSLYEGFGLPVLEAMSVNTPVITTECGALKEVGGDAAIFVEPDGIEAMSLALTQCLLVPEGVEILKAEGKKRAERFTWDYAAEKTLEVLERVAMQTKN
jgi:glycosyltransferase involved in cell wall biosynthesis